MNRSDDGCLPKGQQGVSPLEVGRMSGEGGRRLPEWRYSHSAHAGVDTRPIGTVSV